MSFAVDAIESCRGCRGFCRCLLVAVLEWKTSNYLHEPAGTRLILSWKSGGSQVEVVTCVSCSAESRNLKCETLCALREHVTQLR
jgi:hypothetical protein